MAFGRHAVALALVFACTQAHAQGTRTAKVPTRTKSPALIAGGVGTVFFGLALGGATGFLTFWATTSHACSDSGCDSPPYALLGVAAPMGLLSLTAIVGGIAMMTIGARQIPADTIVVGADGPECSTTAECGSLHCIDGRCRAIEPLSAREGGAPAASPSSAVMFGNGRGYVTASVITDVCAVLTTVPPWMVAYAADFSRFMTGFQIAPLVQLAAGPALHLYEGRIGPAFISLLGWTTVAMTTYFVPTVVSPYGDEPNGLAAGTAMLIGGGIAMTIVDAILARPHRASREPQAEWAPSVQPVPGGLVTGLAGAW